MTDNNAAFNALWHPFVTGALAWNETGLFLRARSGVIPQAIKTDQLECRQGFKPFADDLMQAGWRVTDTIGKTYPMVLLLPPPQRDETRALFASAMQNLSDEGLLIVSMQNNAGAKSGEDDLRQLAPNLQSLSKNKCRVFWTRRKNLNESLQQSWLKLDEPRMIEATGLISRPGVFAWDRIDSASRLLTEHLPNDLSGQGADLGAGVGYLTHTVLLRCKNIKAMDVYEAEARALECAKLNLSPFAADTHLKYFWHDVAKGIQGPYDFVISNPPFHQGREEVQALGKAFIGAAAKSLKPGGRFYMVANRHLPYEASLKNHFSQVNMLAMQDGFKVFAAIK